MPAILPVLDLMGGHVVWGIAGRRDEYEPLRSPLCETSQVLDVSRGLRQVTGHDWMYVADLDAIQGDTPHESDLRQLVDDGCKLIVDAGLRHEDDARCLIDAGVELVVGALETLPSPRAISRITTAVGGQRVFFSLDLKQSQPLGSLSAWGKTPFSIGQRALACGVGGVIVLDLAGVGTGRGVPTQSLCRDLRAANDQFTLITGGGVRHIDDVRNLLQGGVDCVLVASALHRGTITQADLSSLDGSA